MIKTPLDLTSLSFVFDLTSLSFTFDLTSPSIAVDLTSLTLVNDSVSRVNGGERFNQREKGKREVRNFLLRNKNRGERKEKIGERKQTKKKEEAIFVTEITTRTKTKTG
jgi:hypothetical protein